MCCCFAVCDRTLPSATLSMAQYIGCGTDGTDGASAARTSACAPAQCTHSTWPRWARRTLWMQHRPQGCFGDGAVLARQGYDAEEGWHELV